MEPVYRFNETYSIQVFRDWNALAGYEDAWNDLARRQKSYQPWFTFEWFHLLAGYLPETYQPLVLFLLQRDEVVAIAAFGIRREKYKGLFNVNKIELLGNHCSPVRTIIMDTGEDATRSRWLEYIVRFLRNELRNWNIIEFDSMPTEHDIFALLGDTLTKPGLGKNELKVRDFPSSVSWYSDEIDYSFDEYFRRLPKKLKKDVEYCRRRLGREGDVQFVVLEDGDKLEEYERHYYSVRDRSWKAPEKDTWLLSRFTGLCADKGWLRLAFLFFNGTPIAAQKWIVYEDKAYIWDILHDESFKKYSPGKVLTAYMIERVLTRDGVAEIDFMTGNDPYKKDWTPRRRERKGYTVFNNTAKGIFMFVLLSKLIPLAEKNPLLHRLKNAVVLRLQASAVS